MEEWKAVLEETKEMIARRFQPLFDQLTASQGHLQDMKSTFTSLMPHPEEENPPQKPKPTKRTPVLPQGRKPNPPVGVFAPRRSIPTLLVTQKNFTHRQSLLASRNQMIAAAAAATTRRRAEDLSLKAKKPKPSLVTKRVPALRKPITSQLKPSENSSKKTDELSSLPSISELSGTPFPEGEDVYDVSGVSPIEGGEGNSRASFEDIAIIEQELAALRLPRF